MKEVAPSAALRKWFGHDPVRWPEFYRRYTEELREQAAGVEALRTLAQQGTVTLVFGARDLQHNGAVVLRDFLGGTSR